VLSYLLHPRLRGTLFIKIVALALLLALAGCGGRLSLPGSGPTAQSVAAAPSAQFTPTLALNPTSGYAGIYVGATGAAWPPNMMVVISMTSPDGKSMSSLASKDTDSSGNLTTGFLYPIDSDWLQPGIYTVIAESADGKYQAKAPFTVVRPGEQIAPTVIATATVAAITPTAQVTVAVAGSTATSTPIPTAISTAQPTATAQPTPTNSPTPQVAKAEAASGASNQEPVVSAALVPLTDGPGLHRQLRADFTASDPDNNLSAVVAVLQIPVPNSSRNIQLRVSDKIEISINPGRIRISAPNPRAVLDSIRQLGGLKIQNGQLIDYMPGPEQIFRAQVAGDKLYLQAAPLRLLVIAMDSAGLSQQLIVSPPSDSEQKPGNDKPDNDKPGKGHDKKDDKGEDD